MRHTAVRLGTEEQSKLLTTRYEQWARAFERRTLCQYGLGDGHTQEYEGRARMPTLKEIPLLRKPRLSPQVYETLGGYGIVARLWATLATLARK